MMRSEFDLQYDRVRANWPELDPGFALTLFVEVSRYRVEALARAVDAVLAAREHRPKVKHFRDAISKVSQEDLAAQPTTYCDACDRRGYLRVNVHDTETGGVYRAIKSCSCNAAPALCWCGNPARADWCPRHRLDRYQGRFEEIDEETFVALARDMGARYASRGARALPSQAPPRADPQGPGPAFTKESVRDDLGF